LTDNRNFTLDYLRSFAIICIMLTHSELYIFNNFLAIFSPYFAVIGIGLFVFLTGYTINLNNKSLKSPNDITIFYKKRFLRIYPLYWVSLSTFIIASVCLPKYYMYASWTNIFLHIIGGQILLAPYSTPFPTLWFIGLACSYYLIYPALILYRNNTHHIAYTSMIIFVICYIVRERYNIIDDRFFLYFFIFLAGIISNQINLLDNKTILKYVTITPLILVMSLVLNLRLTTFFSNTINSDAIKNITTYLVYTFIWISFIIIEVVFVKFSTNCFTLKTKYLITQVSIASYCVFLFHRPILGIFYELFRYMNIPHSINDILIFLVIMPMVFMTSYHIQILYNKYIYNHYMKRCEERS